MDAHLYREMYDKETRHWWFVARRRIIYSQIMRFASQATSQRLKYYNTLLFAPAALVRIGSKLARRRAAPGDLRRPPQVINSLLTAAFASETNLLRQWSLPFGLSLIAVARQRSMGPRRPRPVRQSLGFVRKPHLASTKRRFR